MREIKFRAWDTNYEPACISDDGQPHPAMEYFGIGTGAYTDDCDIQVDGDDPNVTIMQYTGLKDKNGVEIYEGDILKHPRGIYFVEFGRYLGNNGLAHSGFFLKQGDEVDSNTRMGLDGSLGVIGNIYENPEVK